MKRILVFGMTENPGGVESFLMNYYRNIDRTKLQFDFLCNSYNPIAYEDELINLGARTFHIISRRENRKKFRKELEYLFMVHSKEWSAIWVNVCSLANIDYLKVAKDYGIPKRIIHSHNSENMDSKLRGALHLINKTRISNYATDFWACSEDAAKWFYSKDIQKKAIIIKNAIDASRYKFDQKKRDEIREQIKASEETFVIGNVGRLHFQKNQDFAIDVFKERLKKHENSLLVLVGQGEDEKELKEKCQKLGLLDKVIFAGVQKDIGGWLSAFDLFLFPSVFEGLGIVALEAQANGVPVLASDKVIPKEVQINQNFHFCDLKCGASKWAEIIEQIEEKDFRECFRKAYEKLAEKGFEIEIESKKAEKLLIG